MIAQTVLYKGNICKCKNSTILTQSHEIILGKHNYIKLAELKLVTSIYKNLQPCHTRLIMSGGGGVI